MVVFLKGTVPSKEEGPKFNDIICIEPGWKKSFPGDLTYTVDKIGTPPEKEAFNRKTVEFLIGNCCHVTKLVS